MEKILQWRHNGHDSISNHQPRDCLLNRLYRRRSKKTSKLRVTGLCAGNSPGTGEFPTQMASNAENVSIWWRHHDIKNWENWSRSPHHWSLCIMTSWHGSVFHIDGPLCGESSGDSWSPFTNGQQMRTIDDFLINPNKLLLKQSSSRIWSAPNKTSVSQEPIWQQTPSIPRGLLVTWINYKPTMDNNVIYYLVCNENICPFPNINGIVVVTTWLLKKERVIVTLTIVFIRD